MQVLVIILNKVEYLDDIVKILRTSGIRGATILDGLGSRSGNNRDLNTKSFFSSIIETLEQVGEVKKILFSVVEKEIQIEKAVSEIDTLVNTTKDKESGTVMFTLPVNYMRGGELERHIERRNRKREKER